MYTVLHTAVLRVWYCVTVQDCVGSGLFCTVQSVRWFRHCLLAGVLAWALVERHLGLLVGAFCWLGVKAVSFLCRRVVLYGVLIGLEEHSLGFLTDLRKANLHCITCKRGFSS